MQETEARTRILDIKTSELPLNATLCMLCTLLADYQLMPPTVDPYKSLPYLGYESISNHRSLIKSPKEWQFIGSCHTA